jgi:hypothetical protein
MNHNGLLSYGAGDKAFHILYTNHGIYGNAEYFILGGISSYPTVYYTKPNFHMHIQFTS